MKSKQKTRKNKLRNNKKQSRSAETQGRRETMTEMSISKETTSNDSSTNVSFCEGKVSSVNFPRKLVYDGGRNVVSIRVDKTLYLAFKIVAKRRFGSVCKPIEAFMAGVITLDKLPEAYLRNTVVLNQTIERNLTRERRNVTFVGCEVARCRGVAVGQVTWRGRPLLMCRKHFVEFKESKDVSEAIWLDGSEKKG